MIKTINELVGEIKKSYNKAEIALIIAGLNGAAKTKKTTTKKDHYKNVVNLLNFVTEKNKIRPSIDKKVLVTTENIIATDLEQTLFIKNIYTVPSGIYTNEMIKLKTYSNTYNHLEQEFPESKIKESGMIKMYNVSELKRALNEVSFAASTCMENLSVCVVRFEKEGLIATDTYKMIKTEIKPLSSVFIPFSLPLKTVKTLEKVLSLVDDDDDVLIYEEEDRVFITSGDYHIQSRIIDLAFPDFKAVYDGISNPFKITLNHSKSEIIEFMKQLIAVSKTNPEVKNSFIMNFAEKTLSTVNTDNKIKLDFDYRGEIELDKIKLNARFILDYLKTTEKEILEMEFKSSDSAVILNQNYLIMPLNLE